MMLDDLGLIPTLKRYVDILKDRSNMDIRLFVTGKERRLESYQEVMIFRAIQELLYNAVRYSQASVVKVTVESSDTSVKVIVDDDGKGFDGDKITEKSSGMGLKVIRDRVEMVGGSFEIDSIIGQGTRVTFELPSLDRANRD
jgi:two-component system sensor histidine kinase DegS